MAKLETPDCREESLTKNYYTSLERDSGDADAMTADIVLMQHVQAPLTKPKSIIS